jgi:formylglycine-generating enzyme required for sulfatase activity
MAPTGLQWEGKCAVTSESVIQENAFQQAKPAPSPQPQAVPKSSTNSIGMEFVTIPAGKFMMGCSAGDSKCHDFENPRHEVAISRSFELGKYEVTQGQWVKAMGNNPSNFKGDERLPVETVNWDDAQAFMANLSSLNDGYRYRLPTEAEWEYAARGGTTGPYYAIGFDRAVRVQVNGTDAFLSGELFQLPHYQLVFFICRRSQLPALDICKIFFPGLGQ